MRSSSGLARLASLYGRMTNLRSIELRAAAAALEEVRQAEAGLRQSRQTDGAQARRGLEQGSRVEALACERTALADRAMRFRLRDLAERCAQAHESAVEVHRESRIEEGQLLRVMERAAAAEQGAADRTAQATADDRFLARRAWLQSESARRPT